MGDELLEITIDDSAFMEIVKRLEHFEMDQLPFALAGSLYDVAIDAREKMRRQLPKIFTIRQPKPWASRALIIHAGSEPWTTKSKRTSKKDLRNKIKSSGDASISIVSRDEDLGPLLTDGGIRKRDDGKEMGVPIVGGARKTIQSKLTRRTSALNILKNNPRAIIITSKNGKRLMVLTPSKYKKGIAKKDQHKAMFHMRNYVNIKPWWNARDILLAEMNRQLPKRFEEHCEYAMWTRK